MLRCPICKKELFIVGKDYLETLGEHVQNQRVSLKNRYECVNRSCIAYHTQMHWNEDGDYYSHQDYMFEKFPFIDNNSAPFGSYQRQANVEIYKKDENFTLLNLHFICFFIEWAYRSNRDGEILSKRPKLVTCVRSRGNLVHYIPGIKMFFFCISRYRRDRKMYLESKGKSKTPSIFGALRDIAFNKDKWDKRWWKMFSNWLIRTFDRKIIKEVQEVTFTKTA